MRYEGQVKARQQKELADAVMAKVDKELQNPKVLEQILKQSVQDIERKYARHEHMNPMLTCTFDRNRCSEGVINWSSLKCI